VIIILYFLAYEIMFQEETVKERECGTNA
jgi:hypothetical protein